MATVNIVMVEPEIPQNTGNVARTCAATGARLHLVGPMGFKIDDKKLKRAGLDYWHLLDITYYDSLEEFFEKNSGEFSFSQQRRLTPTAIFLIPITAISFSARKPRGFPRNYCYATASAVSEFR